MLLVQDATELDFTRPKQQVRGAGPMESEVRRGAFFHPLMAFDLTGLPLGTVWQKSWARENIGTKLTKQEKNRKRKQAPIEEKESLRWVEGIRAARKVAEACPQTTCVCVGDSESDIYDFFLEPRSTKQGETNLRSVHCVGSLWPRMIFPTNIWVLRWAVSWRVTAGGVDDRQHEARFR